MKLSTLLKWGTVALMAIVFIGGWAANRAVLAQPNIWHVASNGSDITGDGSEVNPFATIQHGIAVASNDDTVLVHPGVYKENINFQGKNIIVGSLFVTTGDEDYILRTVINGNRSDHVVAFASGEEATARLSGFTISNGYAHGTSTPGSNGGGIFCLSSNPTLTHLKVTGNEAIAEGGGLYFGQCSATIQDVMITNNLAGTGGGGIRFSYGSVSLENVSVAHNSARIAGAGVQFYHANGTIKNALIADNSGAANGGGLHFDGCSPTFINVTVVGNWTTGQGGGLNVSYMSQPTLVNSIVWGNSPEQIYFDTNWPGEAVTIEHSDIQGGQTGIVTNGQGPVHWGNGNLDASPRFVNAGLDNYHLSNDSPAINAGTVAGAPSTDIESNPRPSPTGSNPDMGAYENPFGLKVHLPIVTTGATVNVAPGPALQFPRARHTATRLVDGRVLLVGGYRPNESLAEVDLFDPATGSITQVAPLHTPRHDHSATLLRDGRVLVVGGYSAQQGWLSDAEVYDPSANTWTVVPPRYSHGHSHTATLMKDGRVLVVGGSIGSGLCTERAEIFKPQTNSWTEAPSLPTERYGQTADLLNDGRVLVAGGHNASGLTIGGDAFVYDPRANSWTTTGPMVTQRAFAESVQFTDGRVLVAGGAASDGAPILQILSSAEIYDPASNTWRATAPLANARYGYILTLFPSGQVLAVGGARDWDSVWSENSFVREIEVYDSLTGRWHTAADLPRPGAYAAAVLLRNNRLWVTGGEAGQAGATFWSDTWLLKLTPPAQTEPTGTPLLANKRTIIMHKEVTYRLQEVHSLLDKEPMTKGVFYGATARIGAHGVGISFEFKDWELRTLLFELEQATSQEKQSFIQNIRIWFEELDQLGPQAPFSEAEPVDPQKVQVARDKFGQIEREWQHFLEQFSE